MIQEGRSIAAHREKPVSNDHFLLVLSQDCDINNSQDQYIELLPIKKLPQKKAAVQQQKNRNFRKLQLLINGAYWILEAELISIIPKSTMEKENLKVEGKLNDQAKSMAIDWRVGIYNRRPFPDKFNQEFISQYLKNPDYDLGAYLETHHNEIIDLFIYVEPSNDEQAPEYRVSMTALINEDCSDELEEEIRDTLMSHCRRIHALPNSLKMSQVDNASSPEDLRINQEIVLRQSDFTLLDAQFLRRITLDYLCYPPDA